MPCASREFGRVRGGSRRRRFNTILKAANLKNRSALPPSRAAAIAREETNEKTAFRDAVGCTLDRGQEAKGKSWQTEYSYTSFIPTAARYTTALPRLSWSATATSEHGNAIRIAANLRNGFALPPATWKWRVKSALRSICYFRDMNVEACAGEEGGVFPNFMQSSRCEHIRATRRSY